SIFLVICDLYMPIMNGYSLFTNYLDFFSKNPKLADYKAKFVLLTASTNPNDLSTAEKIGFSHVFNKPIGQAFLNTVQDICDENRKLFLNPDMRDSEEESCFKIQIPSINMDEDHTPV
ncbi:MAG: hypothetical protein K2X66_11285, partial [Cyanobacteria bacterium]|nr:hypothetical protein [Cyanobacteriota bacterium]